MDLSYPSSQFPARPSIALSLPDTFTPLISPTAIVAAVDTASPAGFTSNLLVICTRVIVDVTLEELAADVRDKTIAEYPTARSSSTERFVICGHDCLATVLALKPPDLPFEVEQLQTVVLVPSANPEIRDLLQVHATYAASARDPYASLFHDAVQAMVIS